MRNVVGRRKFAPNPWEERWTPAFPVSSNRKNQQAPGQNNYCYVCVAKKRDYQQKARRGEISPGGLGLTNQLELKTQIRLDYLVLIDRVDSDVASSPGPD
jgi:hypothetical protein